MSSATGEQPTGGGAGLLCPKCVSQMLPVNRFGVEIDQCTGCGGVFLDRGEMEQLATAEARFYAAAQPTPPSQPAPPQYAAPAQPYYPPPAYGERRHGGGFLGELFGQHEYRPQHGGHHGGHH
ncbi:MULTISPECIES: TFIIB-type zinc ribbon-containing protein [Amycolatopsis]|uniref:Zf-TFIIB domain-containing protein n=1 Tax=Amycolatopsis echigonensis TaxID=2576905 RepID=A0A2N3WL98_9PSEU|nr:MULTISPECIES: zf-TFIIB domain-containing protein [Amycolatopsis]MBB2500849.1 zf-TFIIB domain-containing protein [Amycolatopsis echigonensis]MCG3751194.1 zf-TFIIB domain-containing protein [Amycolatopsis sp. Poz14]PKV94657.1 hypothetical protein ATK30_5537 [Amycolatopsis niigatensis]